MAFTIDESFLPATLTASPMTDAEFVNFCEQYPDLFFEMSAEGEIIVMAPTSGSTGVGNAKIIGQLDVWAEQNRRGIVTDSSTGFVLPNGARRSPDAAWTKRARIDQLSQESREGFFHLCPDFVVELRSNSDRLSVLRGKMREYMANGAQLGWLIDPKARTVEIYRQNQEPELVKDPASLAADGPVEGFVLEMARIWNPLG